jgi:hypothetical protein
MTDETQLEGAILCRSRVQLAPTITGEAMYMPAGLQEITPFSGGVGKPIKINVDANGAAEIEAQRAHLAGKGRQPYFDFDHADGPASFWIESFSWKPDGIYAKGEWTQRGKQSVEGKEYRYFSPVFYVDDKHGDPAKIQCRKGAKANMGALINDPAFHNILPLWAKNASGDAGDKQQTKEQQQMEENEIAALRANKAELEKQLAELKAKQESGEDKDAEVRAIQAEVRANEFELKAKEQEKLILQRSQDDAKAHVKDAILEGRIKAKDIKTQEWWIKRLTADPSALPILKSIPRETDRLNERIIGRQIQIVSDDPTAICAKMRTLQRATAFGEHGEKMVAAREFAAVYAEEFDLSKKSRILGMPVRDLNKSAIMAGDVTDASLGTLAGTLVTQRTLELLKFIFPELTSFTTDFSDQPVTFNQTIMTRTVTIPTVSTYSTSTGWADSAAATGDVPVVLNNHKGVQITFNEQILASTVRKLFEEFAPAQSYALGKSLVDGLYGNITDANFTNNQVSAIGVFNRNAVIDLATNLTLRGVPNLPGSRTLLLYSTFFGQLEKDSAIVSLATFQRPELITGQTQDGANYAINVEGFKVVNAPNLPTNNANLNGFAASKSALIIVTRTPSDYTSVMPGASYGTVQMVTEPDIGITVMLVQFVTHQMATASSRIALMFGTAAGQGNAGTLLKSNAGSGSSH